MDRHLNIDPSQQIYHEKNTESLLTDLAILSNKYKRYNDEQNKTYGHKINDRVKEKNPLSEIIVSKDEQISNLKIEIDKLKQELIDTTIAYNLKLEQLRSDHRNDLQRQYLEFMKKLTTINHGDKSKVMIHDNNSQQ
jgi:hypothetical protein